MNIHTDVRMDKARFFAWLECQDQRHELVDGKATMLPYVTRKHWTIASNICAALIARLDRSRFGIGVGDFAVETGDRTLRYADVMVEPFNPSGSDRSTNAALFLAEILSPSTMHIDFGSKLDEYKSLSTLGTYIICAQHEERVWVWTRKDGQWPDMPEIVDSLAAAIPIPVLGTELPMSELYAHVALR